MPRRPDKETLNAASVKLDPVNTLTAVINDMHNPELEDALVKAGYAQKVEE